MSIIHPHTEFPDIHNHTEFNVWWAQNADLFLRVLQSPRYRRFGFDSALSQNLLIYPPKCDIMEENMNGRKSKSNGTRLGGSNGVPLPFRWINIPLTSEDLNTLELETADLEQLACAFIQLGMRGLGLSVKYDSVRKSYSVSIYRPSDAVHLQPCGISGSSPDLRDALLVSLYRFNHCLGGSFDNAPDQDMAIQSGRFK